jgi:hypothetical protein
MLTQDVCEHDNEFLGSIEDKKLQQLSNCQILKEKEPNILYFLILFMFDIYGIS